MPSKKLIRDRAQLTIVLAIVKNEQNQVLIARRNDETLPTAHNKWELIGGRLEWDESPEEALVREVKEESGLDVAVTRLLPKVFHNYWTQVDGTQFKVILIPFECKLLGGELHTSGFDHKIGELKFVDFQDIDQYDFLPLDPAIIKLAYA